MLDTGSPNVHNSGMEVLDNELFALRQQAGYWRALHERAAQRASALETQVAEFKGMVRALKASLAESAKERDALKARIAWLERQVFGAKGEQSKDSGVGPAEDEPVGGMASNTDTLPEGRKRGQQRGKKSAGRQCHPQLPAEAFVHNLPELERCCPKCGLGFHDFPGTEDCEEIHWEVRLVRRVHRRKRYRRGCNCSGVAGIVTAPVPPKLFPKGKFSTEFWVRILEQKYWFQIPLHRTLKMLEAEGARFVQGTITDGLKRIADLIHPLYARILGHSREAAHWHMDETRWLVFEEVEGKKGHRWWLWIVVTRDTCV
ncbi:MAG TPA: transposase, partial [Paracoccaceae bacterium]|nr:transposase [Paracoccaceae bacterium]